MANDLHSKSLKELRVLYPNLKSNSKKVFLEQVESYESMEQSIIIEASQGLGDTIEKVLESPILKPITKAVKKIIFKDGDDCGCKERKANLNKLFKYKRKAVRCLDEDEYNRYKKYTERRTLNKWEVEDIQLLIDLYAKVFAVQYYMRSFCKNCNGSGQILLKMSNELDLIYESYDNRE